MSHLGTSNLHVPVDIPITSETRAADGIGNSDSPFEPLFARLMQQVVMNLVVLVPLCIFESWFYQRDLKKEWGYFGVTSSASAEEKLANDAETKNVQDLSPSESPNIGWLRFKLAVCAFGLIAYHLLWGLFQERLVRTVYDDGQKFSSTTFLVFCSRFFGMVASAAILKFSSGHLTTSPASLVKKDQLTADQAKGRLLALLPPLMVFSPPSVSNTLSSWCQLEALKYTSFPAQVIMKTFKMVPLIVMGTLMGKKYPLHEYGIAIVVACGVTLFVDGIEEAHTHVENDATAEISAAFLKILYLVSDSFTAQWQETLFKEYKLSSYQMMLGMNICSCFLALVSLILSHEFTQSAQFLYHHPLAMWHIIGFSLSGAMGQIFIFETIKEFGAVTFALITTTRQMIAVVLSIMVFGHTVTSLGWFGAAAAFTALIIRLVLAARVSWSWLKFSEPRLLKTTSSGPPVLPAGTMGTGTNMGTNFKGSASKSTVIARKYRLLETDHA